MDSTSQSCSVEHESPEDNKVDEQPWPKSRFSKEERIQSLKKNFGSEGIVDFRPFADIEANFPIEERNTKWCDPKTARLPLDLHKRLLSSRLITKLGQTLRVNQLVINTAIVYVTRFRSFHPTGLFPHELTAAVALRLASKYHDVPRSYDNIKAAMASIDISSALLPPKYEVDLVEGLFLATFGFDLEVDHYMMGLDGNLLSVLERLNLLDAVRSIANESLQITTFCIRYPTSLVNAFIIYVASQSKQCEIPMSRDGKPWYHFVNKSISLEMLERMKDEFMSNKEAISRSPKIINSVEAHQKIPSQKRGNHELDDVGNQSKIARLSASDVSVAKNAEPVTPLIEKERTQSQNREKFVCERQSQSVKVPVARDRVFSVQSNQGNTGISKQSKSHEYQLKLASPVKRNWKNSFSVVPDKGFKLIKSTVPSKIKPIKHIVDQNHRENVKNSIVEESGNYTSAKPAKQRISHYRQHQDKVIYEEPDINQVSHVEEVWSSGEASSKSDQSSCGESNTQSFGISLKQNKSHVKKQKHKLKRLAGVAFNEIKDKVSLKITFKKANDGTEHYYTILK